MTAFRVLIATALMIIAASANAQVADGTTPPNVAMMICYGVKELGNKDTQTAFHVVMEQTNADDLDGSELLKAEIYDKPLWLTTPVIFRVRIYRDVKPFMIEGDTSEIANHLMGSTIPSEAYEEVENASGRISFRSLRVIIERETDDTLRRVINYKPSNKLHERYFDRPKDESFQVYCEDPFLKG